MIRLFHNDPDRAGGERPAVTYDPDLADLYLIQNADGNFNGSQGRLRLFSISGNVDAPTLNYLNPNQARYIVVSNTGTGEVTWANTLSTNRALWQGCCAPQKDTDVKIGTVSSAQIDTVVYRNGFLWCAQTIFLPATNPSRSAVQWWQISPQNTNVIQRGRIDDGINFYAFGSIGVNRFNDVLIGYSSFSTNQYASANYSFRHFYMQINDTLPPHPFKEGEDIWSLGRWGDYSATVVDPLNDANLWTIQQYARLDTNYPTFAWGTWWAQVLGLKAGVADDANLGLDACERLTGCFQDGTAEIAGDAVIRLCTFEAFREK